jgi:hypothetical protein
MRSHHFMEGIMRPLVRVVLALAPAVALACGGSDAPTDPSTAAELAAGSAGPGGADRRGGDEEGERGRDARRVVMLDECDPRTFNAALGEGTCVGRHTGITFEKFIATLTRLENVPAWRFAPAHLEAELDQTIVALNKGGEVHTFTRVAEFGGGIIAQLNTLAGTPTVAPECTDLDPDDFVAAGGTYTEHIDVAEGTLKFQCCIHPWMRAVVKLEHHEGDHGGEGEHGGKGHG